MPGAPRGEPWLPDLCRPPRIAAMLGLAQPAVVVAALVPVGGRGWDAHGFLIASSYALWLALSVTALLCVLRERLSLLPGRSGALAAVALALVVAAVAAAIVHGLFASVDTSGAFPGFWRFTGGSAAVVGRLLRARARRYFCVIDRWQALVQAHARAEADALQARSRPHFQFNSMNMIAGLLRRDPALAERAVLDLSDLFRAALVAGEGR